jgi:hypothetical protein
MAMRVTCGACPIRKVQLVDTCFFGEIDRDEVRTVATAEAA